MSKTDTLVTKNGWVLCPADGKQKLVRLPPDGKIRAFVFCKHCRREIKLDIDLSLSP